MIINFCDYKAKQDMKKSAIFQTLLNYYKDMNEASEISIPYFMEAKNKYNELIKNNKDVNFYYNKICEVRQ